jgi:hypothetical protein
MPPTPGSQEKCAQPEGAAGRLGTPSMVAISESGAWVVGDVAEAVLRRHPSRGVYDFKRVLGRAVAGDPVVAAEAARHGGRLVAHPAATRNRVTGRAVETAKQRAACAVLVTRLFFRMQSAPQTSFPRRRESIGVSMAYRLARSVPAMNSRLRGNDDLCRVMPHPL